MKKIIAAVLLFTAVLSLAGAQELFNYDVPSEIASEFTMNRLYIDFDSGSMGGNMSRSSRSLLGNGSIGAGAFLSSDYSKWEPYMGHQKISESDFFHLTGFSDQAAAAEKYRSTTKTLLWSGGAGYAVGLALSSIPFGIGISRSKKNYAPAGMAYEIADNYNNELKNELMVTYKLEF